MNITFDNILKLKDPVWLPVRGLYDIIYHDCRSRIPANELDHCHDTKLPICLLYLRLTRSGPASEILPDKGAKNPVPGIEGGSSFHQLLSLMRFDMFLIYLTVLN